MGWWVTCDSVGSTRFLAHAALDTSSPEQCDGRWRTGHSNLPGMRVRRARDEPDALVINGLDESQRDEMAGLWRVVAGHSHDHKHPLVYTWARDLRPDERTSSRAAAAAGAGPCCVVM